MSTPRRNRKRNVFAVIFGSLGKPVFWGMLAWTGFYLLVQRGIITNEMVLRYTAGHPVEYIEMAFFFIGVAALVLKLLDNFRQYTLVDQVALPEASLEGEPVERCPELLEDLNKQWGRHNESYIFRRFRDALSYVARKETAEDLDEELRYLSDLDAERRHESLGLVRLVVWAIPILGFLGTVIGITLALGQLGGLSADALGESMTRLTAALGVAFDTTATALALSIILMFAMFLVERLEGELVHAVDNRVARDLSGRFQEAGGSRDPQVSAMRRMGEAILQSNQQLTRQQVELWNQSLEETNSRWHQATTQSQETVRAALSESLGDSLETYAAKLAELTEGTSAKQRRALDEFSLAMARNAELMRAQQEELTRHGEIMLGAVRATGEIVTLQQALNGNLKTLAGVGDFERTVMSLSAAINLLSSQQGRTAAGGDVELEKSQDKAA